MLQEKQKFAKHLNTTKIPKYYLLLITKTQNNLNTQRDMEFSRFNRTIFETEFNLVTGSFV